jgi:ring-1,2-phenylacetyl-CoA epoxidase subunit PaaE
MSNFYKLAIKEIRRETPDAISVAFNIPNELRTLYAFTAGQYVTIKLTLDGQEIRRAYSICSAAGSGELRIAVKSIAAGVFSKFANSTLKAGDLLEVGLPEGTFTFEPDASRARNYAAFVAGSGITPVIAILHAVLEQEPMSSFVMVYGNKTPEQTIFHEQLHQLQNQYTGRFFLYPVYSQVKPEGSLFGRIERSTVNYILNNRHKEMEFAKYFLCGPEEMISTVAGVLRERNVREKDIKFELFFTKPAEMPADIPLEGQTKITVMVDGEETTFTMSRKQTILEAALKQGLDAPYSCQGGICSSCMARISGGTAEMAKNAILTDGEIAEGLTLTCQAHPTSAEIHIDYDQV